MTCPSCNSPLEPNARFCGVCGYRLAPSRPAGGSAMASGERPPRPGSASNAGSKPALVDPTRAASTSSPPAPTLVPKQAPRPAPPKPRIKSGDEIYINQVLNNRFKVESKIGEGGFGAVYRGAQLATGRKVALKLLHPEMTKDENLVARFRREGMVLCNLRDAHTITTYDFDQTPDGTLYIAMELLEGKSLHQLFHEEAPLEWKRVFKILTEMCSSLAEAHTQGIVHRDLKPENIYLESRSGNPEFVKILDFGIAKVMRGDTIDPQSPQLTATGQTLGTLEYMSPEQLMGKPLDGRSDVYALGVLAYEMITGRLPFPDAKGPAGLITAQLKQTPMPPSQAYAKSGLPKAADQAILKCLEKDKNNRYPDVSALAVALQDVIANASSDALKQMANPAAGRPPVGSEQLEARREPSNLAPPPMQMQGGPPAGLAPLPKSPSPMQSMQGGPERAGMASLSRQPGQPGQPVTTTPGIAPPLVSPMFTPRPGTPPPPQAGFGQPQLIAPQGGHGSPMQSAGPMPRPMGSYLQQPTYPPLSPRASRKAIFWWVLALLVVGAGVGTGMALLLTNK